MIATTATDTPAAIGPALDNPPPPSNTSEPVVTSILGVTVTRTVCVTVTPSIEAAVVIVVIVGTLVLSC